MTDTDAGFSKAPTRGLALIVPAAGRSTRMGGAVRKPFIEVRGLPLICHTLRRFQGIPGLDQVIVVAHPADLARLRGAYWPLLRSAGATKLVEGGAERQDSVARGLDALHPETSLVLIHDAVRPFVSRRAIDEAIRAAEQYGAAIVAMPVSDTVKRAVGDDIAETVPRDALWVAQTPQVFRAGLIRQAYAAAERDRVVCTDDAQLVERLGVRVRLVRGGYENIKITTPEQLRMAEALLAQPRA